MIENSIFFSFFQNLFPFLCWLGYKLPFVKGKRKGKGRIILINASGANEI